MFANSPSTLRDNPDRSCESAYIRVGSEGPSHHESALLDFSGLFNTLEPLRGHDSSSLPSYVKSHAASRTNPINPLRLTRMHRRADVDHFPSEPMRNLYDPLMLS